MFLAKKCCFCIKLRTGCIIIALFTLFLGILYLAEFYRLVDENDYKDDSYWYNVMIGATHLLAGFSLFYYLLRANCYAMGIYLFNELFNAIYLILYAWISTAQETNPYINYGQTYCILFWIITGTLFVITIYFIYVATSLCLTSKRNAENLQ